MIHRADTALFHRKARLGGELTHICPRCLLLFRLLLVLTLSWKIAGNPGFHYEAAMANEEKMRIFKKS
jgi:hypothetical protein